MNDMSYEERLDFLRKLEAQMNYRFHDLAGLNHALVHRSYVNENPSEVCPDNERLEFLGDAVLGLCVSDLLMKSYPDFAEGKLSKLRSSIVNEQSLAELACKLSIGDYLLLGRGEEMSGGRSKPSLLSDAFEAVVAAVYLDGGFQEALNFIGNLFMPLIESEDHDFIFNDYKTALQELTQSRFKKIPKYILMSESGPDHDKCFEINLTVAGIISTSGKGKSKKEAEQRAAKHALRFLQQDEARGSLPA